MDRKTSAVIRIVCWSLVAIFLLVVLIAGINGWNFFLGLPWHEERFEGEPISEKQTFDSTQITSVEIDWVSGTVDIRLHDGNDIVVEQTGKGSIPDDRKARYRLENGVLKIHEGENAFHLFNWNQRSTSLTVYLPKVDKVFDRFEIDSTSSDITIEQLTAGDLEIDSTSGRINLGTVHADTASVDTVSGKVDAQALQARLVDIESVSGTAKINGSVQEFDGDTTSGSIEVTSSVCPKDFRVNSISGAVKLYIPENDGFTAQLNAVSGSFSCDFATNIQNDGYVYQNGEAQLRVDSVSGGFTIKKIE